MWDFSVIANSGQTWQPGSPWLRPLFICPGCYFANVEITCQCFQIKRVHIKISRFNQSPPPHTHTVVHVISLWSWAQKPHATVSTAPKGPSCHCKPISEPTNPFLKPTRTFPSKAKWWPLWRSQSSCVTVGLL